MANAKSRQWQESVTVAATLVSVTLICGSLYWAKPLLVPVAMAILFTFLLAPLVMRLDRLGSRRVVSVLVVISGVSLALVGLFWLVGTQVQQLGNDLEQYKGIIQEKFAQIKDETRGGTIEKVQGTLKEVIKSIQDRDKEKIREKGSAPAIPPVVIPVRIVEEHNEVGVGAILGSLAALSPVFDVLPVAGLTLLLTIFMLVKFEDLRNRLISFTPSASVTLTTKALDDAGQRISRYLLMQLLINSTFGITIGIGLWFIGIPYSLLWGLCAAVFRYIPYIGPWIAACFPLLVGLITFANWAPFVLTFGLFLVIEMIMSNVLEPLLYGHETGISEVALLVAATFWTLIWGPMGLILSTPLTVILVVLGRHVEALKFLDRLLGQEPSLDPYVALVQRLLARDHHEAREILLEQCKTSQPAELFDNVLVPALKLVRRERLRGHMSAEEESQAFQSVGEIMDCTDPPVIEKASSEAPASPILPMAFRADRKVVGLPAHHEADELTLRMLGKLLSPHGVGTVALSTKMLPSEVLERVGIEKPALIVIAILPPSGEDQAIFLCKRLHRKYRDIPIMVGLWGYKRDLDKVIVKFREAGARYVTTTLNGAVNHVMSFLPGLDTQPSLAADVPASVARNTALKDERPAELIAGS